MRKSTSGPSMSGPSTSQQTGKNATDDFGDKPFQQQAYVSQSDASGAAAPGSLTPEADLPRWATRAPEGEKLESTQYADRVQHDLSFVKAAPGVAKPDPILVADNITRKFGGVTAVDVQHFEIERHRADWPERCRQNHLLQPHDRLRYPEHRHVGIRR